MGDTNKCIFFILTLVNKPNPSIGEFFIVNPSGNGLYINYPFCQLIALSGET